MVQQHSFKDYVKSHHFNKIFEAVEDYVPNNIGELNLWSNSIDIDNLDEEHVFFDEMKIEFVFVNGDTLTNDIEFDVIVSGEVFFSEADRHDDDYGNCTNWFRLNCGATIDGKLLNYTIHSVEPYDKKQNRFTRKLSDALVSIISSVDYEYEAQQFLSLHFPDALIVSQMVDPRLIAEKMGLTVVYKEITEDLSVFGQIFFHDMVVDGTLIKAKTILVDDRIALVRGLGALNNTILHECFHWHKHRLSFELVRLYNPELTKINTTIEEFSEINDSSMSPTAWMELQTRNITPKILMPRKMFRQEVELKMREFAEEAGDSLDYIESTINHLATYFGVSKQSAKIRMVELGYEEAIGALNYIDNNYVPAHIWKRGAISSNQTYSIGLIDATIQMLVNPVLQQNSSAYIYVESHICLNLPEYVERDIFGKIGLTEYARHHIDECCLSFTLSLKHDLKDEDYVFRCILNRDENSSLTFNVAFSTDANLDVLEQAQQMKSDQEGLKQVLNEIASLNFGDALKLLMAHPPKTTVEQLAELSGLSDKTILRMRKSEPVTIQSIVAMCIGLHLHPEISTSMLQKQGYSLGPSVEIHMIYKTLLCNCNTKSVEECNELLINANFESLTQVGN